MTDTTTDDAPDTIQKLMDSKLSAAERLAANSLKSMQILDKLSAARRDLSPEELKVFGKSIYGPFKRKHHAAVASAVFWASREQVTAWMASQRDVADMHRERDRVLMED